MFKIKHFPEKKEVRVQWIKLKSPFGLREKQHKTNNTHLKSEKEKYF